MADVSWCAPPLQQLSGWITNNNLANHANSFARSCVSKLGGRSASAALRPPIVPAWQSESEGLLSGTTSRSFLPIVTKRTPTARRPPALQENLTMTLRTTLDFLLNDWLDTTALTARERFADHNRETFDAVLDTCERIAREKYAPFNRLADVEEPRTVTEPDGSLRVVLPQATHDAQKAYAESGMLSAAQDYDSMPDSAYCRSPARRRRPMPSLPAP
eukprot:gene42120-51431_t